MRSKQARLRDECDRITQILGRVKYRHCEICGTQMSCLHHFFPKSTCARLRYDFDNLIPICNGCHMRHHQAGDPKIHGTVIEKRGMEWYQNLVKTSRILIKVNVGYYQQVKEELEKELV